MPFRVAPLSFRGPGNIEAVSDDAKMLPPFHPRLNSVSLWWFANTAVAAAAASSSFFFFLFLFFFLSCCKIYLDFYLPGPNSLIF